MEVDHWNPVGDSYKTDRKRSEKKDILKNKNLHQLLLVYIIRTVRFYHPALVVLFKFIPAYL